MKRGDKKRKKHSLTFFYVTKSELWKTNGFNRKKQDTAYPIYY